MWLDHCYCDAELSDDQNLSYGIFLGFVIFTVIYTDCDTCFRR